MFFPSSFLRSFYFKPLGKPESEEVLPFPTAVDTTNPAWSGGVPGKHDGRGSLIKNGGGVELNPQNKGHGMVSIPPLPGQRSLGVGSRWVVRNDIREHYN